MLENATAGDLIKTIISKISEVLALIEFFEDSRPGALGYTKLEEAMMWLQVMAHNIPLKSNPQDTTPLENNNVNSIDTK